jgi:hypothetical protein
MKNNLTKTSGTAITLILIGSFFFLRNFGFLESIETFLDWRLFLVLFAVLAGLKGEIGGVVVFGILSLCFYGFGSFLSLWPLILVAIGIKKIIEASQYQNA